VKRMGCPLVLAEQNLNLALEVGSRHYIIDNGMIKFEGTSDEIRENDEVKTTYLGLGK
jgi:branched-chain amino acid transport system ATP-binding protein